MITVFIMMACAVPETDNPLAVDNDGDGYTEFQGDLNDNDPDVYNGSDYIHKDDCPEAVVSLDPTVLEVVCPELPDINLSCPEVICPEQPTINLTCPDPPVVNLTCPEQLINTTVEGPDMSQLSITMDSIADILLDMSENLTDNSLDDRQFFALSGVAQDQEVIFTNNDSEGRILVITSLSYKWNDTSSCQSCGLEILKLDGTIISPFAQRVTGHVQSGYHISLPTDASKNGNLTIPLLPGESIVMYSTVQTDLAYYTQGYYQNN